MKERGIIFSGEMVQAILEGRKTQTRRVMKPQPTKKLENLAGAWWTFYWMRNGMWEDAGKIMKCPYGMPGDQLWVRESYQLADSIFYRADGMPDQEVLDLYPKWRWRPAIFMARVFSRITLEIVKIRVERVQEINNEDAKAEGMLDICPDGDEGCPYWSYRSSYQELWNKINSKRGYSWFKNPWVWVIEFKRMEDRK